ncbi:hypothetical protein BDQ12DRAFT_701022 [Crucibulum laeve]|uniref:CxC6 like cysteine cluster associated with KDZ domain-containing protein n=1 Tax=Crucibulum laeve TaxID=68775 RepID=A0A5C3LJ48_9AGAR|nr:hypothetical protein BDQ12DRAFT_701022 [Crucibulum laeve]
MGNVANMADFADTQDIKDVDQILASEFGKIKLYISAQDPQTLDISGMKPIAAEVPLSATIKPVLELLGIRYQPIKGSSSLAPNNPPLKNKDRPKISNEHFLELLDLNIDPALVNRKPSDRERNVHIAYQKYKAIIIAIKGYVNAKVKPGGWPSQFQNLTETEIIHMFVSKTSWHNSYKFYHKATGFAVMYDWLQDNDSALGDIAVWGYEKAVYMFQDYELWIAGAEGDKEKEDAIVAAKKKEEIAASSGTTSAAVAKSHKKRKQTNNFVLDNFNSDISLSTVLLVLFTMTNNTALLNLSARAQHPVLKTLAYALNKHLKDNTNSLLTAEDISIKIKLNKLSQKQFLGHLKSISHAEIKPVLVLVPESTECEDDVHLRDMPQIYHDVYIAKGKCNGYRERILNNPNLAENTSEDWQNVYLNSAKYLKVGQNTWVDRIFSNAVVNGIYSFHGSAAAYTEYWNNSFGGKYDSIKNFRITQHQIWQAFITKGAFLALGEEGMIQAGNLHSCNEYFATGNDPASLVGMDDNIAVPPAQDQDEDPELNTLGHNIAINPNLIQLQNENDYVDVKMVVMDGIVMGPQHCSYNNCTSDLMNTHGSVFCAVHDQEYACRQHIPQWNHYKSSHSRDNLNGVRRMLCHPGEGTAWESNEERPHQPHDMLTQEPIESKNYFKAEQFYCVETLCAPCGVVIAWTKFDKSESPTKILSWLEEIYPTPESRPAYICIDKACLVLRSAVVNGDWECLWKKTTCFIVDAYHYKNHRVSDLLCRWWCNPAPANGSAPNLVIGERDRNNNIVAKRAFNTQACEQLNSWLGGFESILKRMTQGNFNWFIHTMLFYHTQYVIQKQEEAQIRVISHEIYEESTRNPPGIWNPGGILVEWWGVVKYCHLL